MLDLPRALDPVHHLTIHYLNHQFVNVQLLRDRLLDTKLPDLLHALAQDHAMTDVFAAHAHLRNENDTDRAVVTHDTVDEADHHRRQLVGALVHVDVVAHVPHVVSAAIHR